MAPISRRKSLLYLAALPFASASSAYCVPQKAKPAPEPKRGSPSGRISAKDPNTWNILLHGLYVIQWKSPAASAAKPNLMRVIFPKVGAGHEHQYSIGRATPGTQGYKLLFDTATAPQVPPKVTNIRFDAGDVSIPTNPADLANVAYCWLDLPQPQSTLPLRGRDKAECCIQFTGTLGQKVAAKVLPAVTLLQYTLAAIPNLDTDINPAPTPGTNLIIRSEPPHAPGDYGAGALSALRACLGITNTQFDVDGDGCPPDPDPQDYPDYGVTAADETSLQEANGEHCHTQQCTVRAIQIRACMTSFAI